MASSVLESGTNTFQALERIGVAADGHLSLLAEKQITLTGNTPLAAPIAFSNDGLNVYMAIPSEAVSALVPRS